MPASASKDTALEILIFAVVDGRSGSVKQGKGKRERDWTESVLYEETALGSFEPSQCYLRSKHASLVSFAEHTSVPCSSEPVPVDLVNAV